MPSHKTVGLQPEMAESLKGDLIEAGFFDAEVGSDEVRLQIDDPVDYIVAEDICWLYGAELEPKSIDTAWSWKYLPKF